ncbi:sodium/panthothenate symporter [Thermoplasmatales archaeon]|nr:sodium/panthothenate symporter [Thermoplasmatales archaeon]
MLSDLGIGIFIALFVVFVFLGVWGRNYKKGDLGKMDEWAIGGRHFSVWIVWFLVGADLYTAYTFIAIPSSVFRVGAIYFYAVPYVALTFGIAMWAMPKLWKISKEKGYVTGADFIKGYSKSRLLAVLVAIVGIVAELPYIGLQIVGMLSVMTVMLHGIGNLTLVTDTALIISFVILAAFTFFNGLRGATLTAIFKDAIILLSVAIVVIVVASTTNIAHAFELATIAGSSYSNPPGHFNLLPVQFNAYWSLFLMSALALYLYPHAVTGSLSAKSPKVLRTSQSLLPLYGIGLAFLALFGVFVYANPSAMSFLSPYTLASRGTYVVPALIFYTLPNWLTGFAFLGIFIGGLVPASIMAISQSNLLTSNIIKEFRPNLKGSTETVIAKIAAVLFIFLAVGFVFLFPLTYSVQLQLLGGIIILQTLPSLFLGLITDKLHKYALTLGLLVGLGTGFYFMEVANHFETWTTTLLPTNTELGPFFIGLFALLANLIVVLVGTLVFMYSGKKAKAAPAQAKN